MDEGSGSPCPGPHGLAAGHRPSAQPVCWVTGAHRGLGGLPSGPSALWGPTTMRLLISHEGLPTGSETAILGSSSAGGRR